MDDAQKERKRGKNLKRRTFSTEAEALQHIEELKQQMVPIKKTIGRKSEDERTKRTFPEEENEAETLPRKSARIIAAKSPPGKW